ncbi:uncharacterized protein BDV17DRAFT_40591 [Aspergillus undulatus]|uniref:uncharacterized protein n=1 Tax=Aspergillus undulatus TaxID=1810928 RepID=UPI003CCE18BB
MARPFYPPDDEVGFDPHTQRGILSLQRALQSDPQQENLDRTLGCFSTGQETEAKAHGRGQTRRRIPVACSRCRKRKIKCSGDDGDGQGCSNCRSAGNTQCHFLRVNSEMLQTKGSGWPYPPNPSHAPSSTRMRGVPTTFSHHQVPAFSRPPDYELSPDSQIPYGRQPFGLEPTNNYENNTSTQNVQSPSAYALPNSPQMFSPDYCGLQWNSRGWGVILQGSRPPAETMYSESDAENPLTHQAYPYIVPGHGPQTTEALSMAPVQASLTTPGQEAERTPDLVDRSPFAGNASDPVTTTGAPPSAHEYRPAYRWAPRYEPRTSMPPSSHMALDPAITGRKLITSAGPDMTFDFLPIASSGLPSPMLRSSGAYAGFNASARTTEATGDLPGDSFIRHNRRMSPLTDYRPDTYGYSRPAYRNRPEPDSTSESTLINGLPYTRPAAPVSLPEMDEKPALHTLVEHPVYTGLCSQ